MEPMRSFSAPKRNLPAERDKFKQKATNRGDRKKPDTPEFTRCQQKAGMNLLLA